MSPAAANLTDVHLRPEDWPDVPGLRWGVVGAGKIAGRFAEAMTAAPGTVTAVSARNPERVARFAEAHGIARTHGSLDALLDDDTVDAVYVATPHSVHDDPVRRALGSGRAVLCEKPMTHSLAATRSCVDSARTSGSFLMEAMWTRFLPAMATAAEWVAVGDIGEPRTLRAGMGFAAPDEPDGRLMSPALAGGALLDIGVYPLALARWAFPVAEPERMALSWQLMPTGVDGQLSVGLTYEGGRLADLSASLVSDMDGTAWLSGSRGRIGLPDFHKAESVVLAHRGDELRRADRPHLVNGLEYQVAAMSAAVADGRTEHPLMPLDDSLWLARVSQDIRDQMGVVFPFEDRVGAGP